MSTDKNESAATGVMQTGGADAKGMRAPRISRINVATIVASILLIVAAGFLTMRLIAVTSQSDDVYARYKACADADTELMEASDYLTTQARLFVTTGNRKFMDNYFEELLVTKRRDDAVATLEAYAGSAKAKGDLDAALRESNELALLEEYAMRLVTEAKGIGGLPEPIEKTRLNSDDEALDSEQKMASAASLVLGDSYDKVKTVISKDVEKSSRDLVEALDREQMEIERETSSLLMGMVAVGILLMVVVVLGGLATHQLVMRPMKIHAENLAAEGHLDHIGCFEIRRVVDSYNNLFDKVQEEARRFKHDAEMDALTNLLNRGSYDRILASRQGDFALVLADIDHFKEINDRYGHETGDEVIRAVANVIGSRFRSTDFVCRLGGDEFAIILPGMKPASRDVIAAKLSEVANALDGLGDDLPKVTLSFGVAFSEGDTEDVYNDADAALYASKNGGRNRTSFFDAIIEEHGETEASR